MAGGASGFKNPDLKQIWEQLADGNIIGYLEILANAANVTNNLVSLVRFQQATIPLIMNDYENWINENPDWTILNETWATDPTDGNTYLVVRYKGEKVPADG